jgi:hypothetical protein
VGTSGQSVGTAGDARVRIAVLDGPVDAVHPCFRGARLEFPQGQPEFDPQSPAARHGTHVASIIFGQAGSGVEGIAPACTGIIVPIFSSLGDTVACSQMELARAILLAMEHGAHIINISGGQLAVEDNADAFLRDALAGCEAAGILVVAAAGNDGCDCVHMPAAIPSVLAVGAADRAGVPLEFSNWGAAYRGSGLLAPGETVTGAVPGGGIAARTGSSYAAPMVSAIAGVLVADQLRRGGPAEPLAVRAALLATADACAAQDQNRCLAGVIDPDAARRELEHGGRTQMNTSVLAGQHDRLMEVGIRPLGEMGAPILAGGSMSADHAQAPISDEFVLASDCGCGCGGEKKADCGCGCGGAKAAKTAIQRVFALGRIGYDFGSEARQDSIRQFLPRGPDPMAPPPPITTAGLIKALVPDGDVQPEVERIIWVLKLDQTPIYAIRPSGAFAFDGYGKILAALAAQEGIPFPPPVPEPTPGGRGRGRAAEEPANPIAPETVDLFSIAGVIAGEIRLMSGEIVPVVVPASRGIILWDLRASLKRFMEQLESHPRSGPAQDLFTNDRGTFERLFLKQASDFRDMMTRKYRNLGLLGRDRALNFAATTANAVFSFLFEMVGLSLIIDDISVLPSPACRVGSECYDVQLRTFRESDVTAALRTFQFTLDVSDTIPVNIGNVAAWSERPTR